MDELIASVLDFARELIRIPSQGGIDPPDTILEAVASWFRTRGLSGEILRGDNGEALAFYAETGVTDAPLYVLDACIDTAAVGSPETWTDPPFSARVHDGWLYGRGAGDSKTAVSIFSHLFTDIAARQHSLKGRLGVLFDADEHTGRFGGIRRFVQSRMDAGDRIAGVSIGYSGMEETVIGARGFYRLALQVPGKASHTGMPESKAVNAARIGAELTAFLTAEWDQMFPVMPGDPDFPFGPSCTVTEIHSGTAFSVVPDSCTIRIDIRLTNRFTAADARTFIQTVISRFPGTQQLPHITGGSIEVDEIDTWPAYTLQPDHPLAAALGSAAAATLGRRLPAIYCGPSNIGNYLAAFGIPATCGFGVECEHFHAADERIRISTIPIAYRTYLDMITRLIGADELTAEAGSRG